MENKRGNMNWINELLDTLSDDNKREAFVRSVLQEMGVSGEFLGTSFERLDDPPCLKVNLEKRAERDRVISIPLTTPTLETLTLEELREALKREIARLQE
ncbi:MAG: hypothetical protein JNM09_19155 [Blastocatellia bacterium]|nr:hypothetical protein [Blastocatellia bacterium]